MSDKKKDITEQGLLDAYFLLPRCPLCGSDGVEYTSEHSDYEQLRYELSVEYMECYATWRERYKLVSVCSLETANAS